MNDLILKIGNLLDENEEVQQRAENLHTPEEGVALLREYGIDITVDEFCAIKEAMSSDEIPEEMLDLVAGGARGKKILKAIKRFMKGFLDGFV